MLKLLKKLLVKCLLVWLFSRGFRSNEKKQIAADKKPMCDGRSRNLGIQQSEKTVLRLATPEDGEIIVNDLIRGEIKLIIVNWMT